MNFAVTRLLDCKQQCFLNGFVVSDLVLRYVNHQNTDAKLGDVLLELQPAADRYQNVKLLLSNRKQRTVIQFVPFLLVNLILGSTHSSIRMRIPRSDRLQNQGR
jgi:hypothetical protein